jgi:hypothetical protein
MARPKLIHDEPKDVHVWLGTLTWENMARDAQEKGSTVSALMRALAEKKYGRAKKG